MIDVVEREFAELERSQAETGELLARARRQTGSRSSVVFTLRLDPDECLALERRAAALGLRPTVLARNLIHTGLADRGPDRLADAVERLDAVVSEIRAIV